MHNILVVANETCPCPGLLEELAERAERFDSARVHIVAPALNSRLRHALSDIDGALAAARERLSGALAHLRADGVDATGAIGDADPLIAVHDALAQFDAHEVILSTHPPERSHWLERGLVERAEAELDVPVLHLVSKYGLVAV